MDVPGNDLVPRVCDGDEGSREVLFAEPYGVQEGSMCGSVGSVGEFSAAKIQVYRLSLPSSEYKSDMGQGV